MGFRFQKRIKLGKGLGVTVSKSGVTPSYRSKRGSISTRGVTVRTGIPGVSYRKNFSKKKNGGCLSVIVLFFTLLMIVNCTQTSSKANSTTTITPTRTSTPVTPVRSEVKKAWYIGGTLHKATIKDWKQATEANQLATCADFVAKVNKPANMEILKLQAIELKICITTATADLDETNTMGVSEIASMCLILMK